MKNLRRIVALLCALLFLGSCSLYGFLENGRNTIQDEKTNTSEVGQTGSITIKIPGINPLLAKLLPQRPDEKKSIESRAYLKASRALFRAFDNANALIEMWEVPLDIVSGDTQQAVTSNRSLPVGNGYKVTVEIFNDSNAEKVVSGESAPFDVIANIGTIQVPITCAPTFPRYVGESQLSQSFDLTAATAWDYMPGNEFWMETWPTSAYTRFTVTPATSETRIGILIFDQNGNGLAGALMPPEQMGQPFTLNCNTVPNVRYYVAFTNLRNPGSVTFQYDPISTNTDPYFSADPNPSDGSYFSGTSGYLYWAAYDEQDGTNLMYTLSYWPQTNPGNSVTHTDLWQSQFYLENLLEDTVYNWQVSVKDSAGVTITGPVWTFITPGPGQWTVGNVPSNGEAWYSFPATVDTLYYVQWDDSYRGSASYSADIYLAVYKSDKSSLYFDRTDSGYYAPLPTFYATENGTVYLKITEYSPGSSYGSFAVRVYTQQGGVTLTEVTVQNQAPGAPETPSPVEGDILTGGNVTLSWNCFDPEDGSNLTYRLQYYPVINPTDVHVVDNISVNAYPLSGLMLSTEYSWQITAIDSKGLETPGPEWHFTTGQPGNLDITIE